MSNVLVGIFQIFRFLTRMLKFRVTHDLSRSLNNSRETISRCHVKAEIAPIPPHPHSHADSRCSPLTYSSFSPRRRAYAWSSGAAHRHGIVHADFFTVFDHQHIENLNDNNSSNVFELDSPWSNDQIGLVAVTSPQQPNTSQY